ncbi:class I SAM-dependent methyltransferase [Lysobacter sp. S4-A87]|uniref:class I SAM-dependent methyltransferase n=1 Tax=Lysobacter sp. S4-A87 TaxID=2925843 RepID=UPI001F535FAA|nr:class I SAM-dependent methyltransferase [Lysobacter sp. S4-A87]UNK48977.1 class I SAM-dependent methyltransferase [Lysobacter sp. S4-A87]
MVAELARADLGLPPGGHQAVSLQRVRRQEEDLPVVTTDRGYQYDYSRGNEQMHSAQGRQRKAATMQAILQEAIGDRLAAAAVLNLGCSTGFIDEFLAGHVASVMGVDIDQDAIALAQERCAASNVRFQVDDAMQLSFADETFDVVICSQVYEHVPDPNQLMKQIHRVLRPGGVCYFAATNRWALMERHHKLPFLSWLPAPMADRYVRLLGKGDAYYERHLGYRELLKLASAFRVDDYTGKVLLQPDRYGAAYMLGGTAKARIAHFLYANLRGMFPGFIWLLWKPEPHDRSANEQ